MQQPLSKVSFVCSLLRFVKLEYHIYFQCLVLFLCKGGRQIAPRFATSSTLPFVLCNRSNRCASSFEWCSVLIGILDRTCLMHAYMVDGHDDRPRFMPFSKGCRFRQLNQSINVGNKDSDNRRKNVQICKIIYFKMLVVSYFFCLLLYNNVLLYKVRRLM